MTQGHHPIHTGLQNHSVGRIYPNVLVGFGDNTWGIRAPNGLYMTFRGIQRFKAVSSALSVFFSGAGYLSGLRPARDKVEAKTPAQTITSPGRWNWYDDLAEEQPAPAPKPTEDVVTLNIDERTVLRAALYEKARSANGGWQMCLKLRAKFLEADGIDPAKNRTWKAV